MRYKFIILMISLLTSTSYAQTLQQDIDRLIEQTLPHASVGVMIQDVQSGQVLYQRNSNKLLSPASNIKMFTAAAALYHFGPDDHYTTSLSQDKNNVYLTFSGSPSLTANDLKQLINKLHLSGTKTITGNIVLDTTQFKPPYHAAGASYDDLGWYFEAPSTAVIINGNAVDYDFISAKELGKRIQIKQKSTDKVLTLINEVQTVSKAQEKDHCTLTIEIRPNNTLRLYGCLSQEERPRNMQLSVPDPNLYAKQIIKSALKDNQILLKGNVVEGNKPARANPIASHQSDNLTKLITHMLEESDNLYADSLTKHLAVSLTGQGTYKQGAFAIKKILAEHSHMDMHQLELADGQGSRYNLVTPKQMVIFLTDLYRDEKIKPIFLGALPRMGVSGTLKDRMKNSSLENHVLAKTGSMHDISALSGYLMMPTGRTVVFSIISNGINGNLAKAKKLEDEILLAASLHLTKE